MKINRRLELLEMAASPCESIANAIRRVRREVLAGTYVRPPYVPGQSRLIDAIRQRRIERGETS
jgi:hypothetical protein